GRGPARGGAVASVAGRQRAGAGLRNRRTGASGTLKARRTRAAFLPPACLRVRVLATRGCGKRQPATPAHAWSARTVRLRVLVPLVENRERPVRRGRRLQVLPCAIFLYVRNQRVGRIGFLAAPDRKVKLPEILKPWRMSNYSPPGRVAAFAWTVI